ncbi:hypothetical protein [Pectobacterium wasabiae]|uniref:hypothetical protein n=1 Tax=Pectobacterium wasabiae TaxID=55208 RepID=UPI00027AFD4A|nr:hypothetical protein [Pectobacterium wasabiae]AOR63832.1 hypothetical protein A7983_11275 [Pectobacterium wasabiae CFBP 3304]EJS94219.1 Hypothetical protein Y17_2265 [Pectobacterium wasabiae CFBP 3304]
MKSENKTEELLEYIANRSAQTVETKVKDIQHFAYPDQEANWNVGQACATCPPPHARKEYVDDLIDAVESRYTVTIYTAYPGTPLNNEYGAPHFDKDGNLAVSGAGHMWLQIIKINKDGTKTNNDSYGFAPIETGAIGNGIVTKTDTIHYESPHYSRTIEITKQQYDKIYEFGEVAFSKSDKYFDLYYNGLTNSCIDFTWKALRHAGITPTKAWNDLSSYNKEQKKAGKFDGDLKVINNIPHIKSIPTPFPNSELNTQKYNKIPPRTRKQWVLSKNENKPHDDNIELASR